MHVLIYLDEDKKTAAAGDIEKVEKDDSLKPEPKVCFFKFLSFL
jgi:hypothetical protein